MKNIAAYYNIDDALLYTAYLGAFVPEETFRQIRLGGGIEVVNPAARLTHEDQIQMGDARFADALAARVWRLPPDAEVSR